MTEREKERAAIDWANLEPLPRKKRHGATRDDLAARKFNIHKAKHKGRNHLSNQKRRQMAREKLERSKVKAGIALDGYRRFKARVAAFWSGELDEHP